MKHDAVVRIYERLLREAEAGPDDPFGRVLFAKRRKKTYMDEEDTKLERDLFKDLAIHYKGKGSSALGDWGKMLTDLVAAGKYTDLLAPPSAPLYRWVSGLTQAGLKRFLSDPPEALRLDAATLTGGGVTKRSTASGVQSWTTTLSAEVFMGLEPPESGGDVILLMEAHPNDNPGVFLLNPMGMRDVSWLSAVDTIVEQESEVVSVGPVAFRRSVALRRYEKSDRTASAAMVAALRGG